MLRLLLNTQPVMVVAALIDPLTDPVAGLTPILVGIEGIPDWSTRSTGSGYAVWLGHCSRGVSDAAPLKADD
jgi:hypothetical protein